MNSHGYGNAEDACNQQSGERREVGMDVTDGAAAEPLAGNYRFTEET